MTTKYVLAEGSNNGGGMYISQTVKSCLMGVGLMAFSVLLSLVDQPMHNEAHGAAVAMSDTQERRVQQHFNHAHHAGEEAAGEVPDHSAWARELVKGKNTFRIASFGSSNMWGAGLDERFDAYPFRMSNEVDNYAMFSGGPNYPAVCTETIVGDDDTYDVILLDFWLKATQGLPELARRLRHRFPHALILFVKLWGPVHARRKPTPDSDESETISFMEWKETVSAPHHQINELIQALQKDDGYWFFPEHSEANTLIHDAREFVGGYQVTLPQKETAKETLEFSLHFFNHESAQLSPMGHNFVRNKVKATIKNHMLKESVEELVNSGTHGDWGKGDSCHVFYTTGGYNEDYSPELVMNEFDPEMGKFALEVTKPGGWFDVYNPFDDERTVYLSFLATQPGFYPSAEVSIGDEVFVLDPHTREDKHHAHLIRTVPTAKVPHGHTRVHISDVAGEEATHLFRLVGVTFTNELAVPLEYGFGPQFNH